MKSVLFKGINRNPMRRVVGERIQYLLFAAFIVLMLMGVNHSVQAREPSFDTSLAIGSTPNEQTLCLTGASVRKKLFLTIYHIAHYSSTLENCTYKPDHNDTRSPIKPASDEVYQSILSEDGTKQVSIIFQRDLSADQIKDALSDNVIRNSTSSEKELVQDALMQFRKAINQDISKHDKFALRWTHDGKLLAYFNDEPAGEFDSPLLARLLWMMWFGENAIVERSELIQRVDDPEHSFK